MNFDIEPKYNNFVTYLSAIALTAIISGLTSYTLDELTYTSPVSYEPQVIKRPVKRTSTETKVYKNETFVFQYEYPANINLEEVKNFSSTTKQLVLRFPGITPKFYFEGKMLDAPSSKTYLGIPINTSVKIGDNNWDILTTQGYCDGLTCGPPMTIYQIVRNDILYAFVFTNTQVINQEQKDLVSHFKFKYQAEISKDLEGKFCGGIAGNLPENQCPEGYYCARESNDPDVGGKCVKQNFLEKLLKPK